MGSQREYGSQHSGSSGYGSMGRQGGSRYGQGTGGNRSQRRGPKGWERSDERIKEDLCERLADSDDVDASEVTVEVREGVVTLDGTVVERWMRYTLEDLADSVSGVKDVQNNVRIARGGESEGSSGQGGAMSMSGGTSRAGSTSPGSLGQSGSSSSNHGSSSGSASSGTASMSGVTGTTRTKE
jgi:hypothetical protein